MSGKGEGQTIETINGNFTNGRPGFGAKVKAHYKRWWWVHVIIFVIVFLVICLPVVYVGYPNIAQSDVNDSTLNITHLEIQSPAPDSLHVDLTQVIGTSSAYRPDLYPFNASLTLQGADTPFLYLETPKVHAVDGAVANISQVASLPSADAFAAYSIAVMVNKTITVHVDGDAPLKLGGLPKTNVGYHKTVVMNGLDSLKGFNVTEFHVQTTTDADGSNANGTVFIPNPTVMTLAMGNVTLNLSANGTGIGTTTLTDLVLRPGDNVIPMKAVTDQAAVIAMITATGSPYANGIVPISIVGNTTVYNGQEIPYFTKALAANTLTVDLNIGAALKEIGLTLGGGGSS